MTKITSAQIKNFQRVEVAKVEPSNHLIVFAGRNAQGKSSGLNALEAALTGHNSRNNPRPIREGADRANIRLELDNGLTIERKYTQKSTTLIVKSTDGNKYGQARLTELIGSLGLDVSRFITLGEKEQRETLLGIVDLPFDLTGLATQRKAAFDTRTDANRRLKELTAQIDNFGPVDLTQPAEETSAVDLIAEYRQATAANEKIEKARDTAAAWANHVQKLEDDLIDARARLKEAEAYVAQQPEAVDTEALAARIETAEETNTKIRRANQYRELRERATDHQREAEAATERIEKLDREKTEGLAAAKMPVEGLTFDDDGLLYNGVPFARASDAEKILVSTAMMIAEQPELRSLLVRNGNNLDDSHLAELKAMAEKHDFQIFIEIVADHGEHEYTFIEGHLA